MISRGNIVMALGGVTEVFRRLGDAAEHAVAGSLLGLGEDPESHGVPVAGACWLCRARSTARSTRSWRFSLPIPVSGSSDAEMR